jgi:SAM-dependent methyltransferase
MSDASTTMQGGEPGYTERLFGRRGLRSFYHNARFKWLAARLAALGDAPLRIFELGCFDGRVLDQLAPERVASYVGIDANIENGLDQARAKFAGRPNIGFVEATDAGAMTGLADDSFDVAIALETLEHVPPASLDAYLDEIARVTSGYFFVSVPVEMGPVFLAKYLAKKALYGDGEKYRFGEVVSATLWRPKGVERGDHKGFDYRALRRQLSQRFEIVSVKGMPLGWMPAPLSLTVGIVCKTRSAVA